MTVTVWGTFQLLAVKVTDKGDTVPSVVSSEDKLIFTSAKGCEFNTIVKASEVKSSDVINPLVGLTDIPAISLSLFVTAISETTNPL